MSLELKTIFVFGPYGSGTTAVTGVLMRLGGRTSGSLSKTNDPRTPTSLEDMGFKEMLHQLINEDNLSYRPEITELSVLETLNKFRMALWQDSQKDPENSYPYILKQPMACILVTQIAKVFNPTKIVYVTRPLPDIEKSRIRRKWPEAFGAKGAHYLYQFLMGSVVDFATKPVWIHYSELENHAESVVDKLASLLDAPVTADNRKDAIAWLADHFKLHTNSSSGMNN
jgi:hypothetical protein